MGCILPKEGGSDNARASSTGSRLGVPTMANLRANFETFKKEKPEWNGYNKFKSKAYDMRIIIEDKIEKGAECPNKKAHEDILAKIENQCDICESQDDPSNIQAQEQNAEMIKLLLVAYDIVKGNLNSMDAAKLEREEANTSSAENTDGITDTRDPASWATTFSTAEDGEKRDSELKMSSFLSIQAPAAEAPAAETPAAAAEGTEKPAVAADQINISVAADADKPAETGADKPAEAAADKPAEAAVPPAETTINLAAEQLTVLKTTFEGFVVSNPVWGGDLKNKAFELRVLLEENATAENTKNKEEKTKIMTQLEDKTDELDNQDDEEAESSKAQNQEMVKMLIAAVDLLLADSGNGGAVVSGATE